MCWKGGCKRLVLEGRVQASCAGKGGCKRLVLEGTVQAVFALLLIRFACCHGSRMTISSWSYRLASTRRLSRVSRAAMRLIYLGTSLELEVMSLSDVVRLKLCKLLYYVMTQYCTVSLPLACVEKYSRICEPPCTACSVDLRTIGDASINYGANKICHGVREGGIPVSTASTQQAHKKRKTP